MFMYNKTILCLTGCDKAWNRRCKWARKINFKQVLCCVQEPGLGLSTKKEQADLLQEVQCFLTVYTVLYTVVFIQCVYAVLLAVA